MVQDMARRAEPAKPGKKSAPRPERIEAFRLGLSAESRAAMFLIAKAYRIVARRWKLPIRCCARNFPLRGRTAFTGC